MNNNSKEIEHNSVWDSVIVHKYFSERYEGNHPRDDGDKGVKRLFRECLEAKSFESKEKLMNFLMDASRKNIFEFDNDEINKEEFTRCYLGFATALLENIRLEKHPFN